MPGTPEPHRPSNLQAPRFLPGRDHALDRVVMPCGSKPTTQPTSHVSVPHTNATVSCKPRPSERAGESTLVAIGPQGLRTLSHSSPAVPSTENHLSDQQSVGLPRQPRTFWTNSHMTALPKIASVYFTYSDERFMYVTRESGLVHCARVIHNSGNSGSNLHFLQTTDLIILLHSLVSGPAESGQ